MVDIEKALRGAATKQEDEKPNAYLMKLMAEHPSEVLPFPRNGPEGKPVFEYRMQVLSQFEIDGCMVDADRAARALFKGSKDSQNAELGSVRAETWAEVYNNAKIIEILLRACRQVEPKTSPAGKTYYDPLFVGGSQMRKLLTPDEFASLFSAYNNVQFKYGPLWRLMSSDEIDKVIEALEEGLDSYPLSQLEPGQLIVLVASLAARNRALKTAIGSFGLPAESGTSETSENGDEE